MKQINQLNVIVMGRVYVGFLFLLLFGFVAAMPTLTLATTVTVQSDHLDIWEQKQEALFTGSVHLVREDFELFCDSLRAFYRNAKEGGGIDHALATGHVRMIQGKKKGSSDSAVIDNRKQLVTLRGHAVMVQEGGRVAGETIVHNLASRTTEVMQGQNSRVTMRIDDKKMDANGMQAEGAGKVPTEAAVDVPVGNAEKPVVTDDGQEQQP